MTGAGRANPRRRGILALAGVFTAVGGLLAACAGGAPSMATAAPIPTLQPSPPAAVSATLAQLEAALHANGLVAELARTAVRPAEPPSFDGVARWPFHATLPDDPTGGYFVIYDFAAPALATVGGHDLAAYVASGPGRVQYPPDVQFVLHQVGSTLVFYAWSPASSPDPRTPDLAAAIASVGSSVPIPPD